MSKKIKKIGDLTFDKKNINKGSEDGTELLTKSLNEVGLGRSVLADKNGVLIAGNKTVGVMNELGLKKIKVVETTGDELVIVQRMDLDINSVEGVKMKILDNTVSKHNYIEDAIIADAICEEFNLDKVELGLTVELINEVEEDGFDAPVPKNAISKTGDLFQLGEHRILCGDSTKSDDVEKLMNGRLADLIATDPPYGVDYIGKTKDKLEVHNDGKDTLSALLAASFSNYDLFSKAGSPIYCSHPAGVNQMPFWLAFLNIGWKVHQQLIWVKDSMVMGHSDYHYQHEPITLCYKKGQGRTGRGGSNWYGDNSHKSVLNVPRPKASINHPTEKPIALWAVFVGNSSKQQDIVLDLFGGSGTTLITCEQMGRICYTQELSPNYVDVIVARWLKYKQSQSSGTASLSVKRNGIALSQAEMDLYLQQISI